MIHVRIRSNPSYHSQAALRNQKSCEEAILISNHAFSAHRLRPFFIEPLFFFISGCGIIFLPVPGAGRAGKHPAREKETNALIYEIASWALLLLAAMLLALVLQACLFQLVLVKGNSMENTLRDKETVFVSRLGAYRRGDVVICRYPHRVDETVELNARFQLVRRTLFIKRLVALPGDTVEIREQTLFVNDSPVADPPRMKTPPRDMPPRTLSKNEYFVMGDNRLFSHDSRARDVGPLPQSALQGRALAVIWPLRKIRRVQ